MKIVTIKQVKNHKSDSFWKLDEKGRWKRISYVDFIFYQQGIKDTNTPILNNPMQEQSRQFLKGDCVHGRKDKTIIIYTCEVL